MRPHFLLMFALCAFPAQAQDTDVRQCEAAEAVAPDARIMACTRLLDTGTANVHSRAMVLTNRAWPYSLQRRFDLAIADLDEALRLMPNSAVILNDRGFARLRMGQLEAAQADYDAALRIDPATVFSLFGRGLVKARRGDKISAQRDFDAARRLQPDVEAVFARLGMKL